MKIIINNKEVKKEELEHYERKQIYKAFKTLKVKFDKSLDLENLREKLREVKNSISYDEIKKKLNIKLKISNFFLKIISLFSFKKSKYSITYLYVDNIDAKKFNNILIEFMTKNTPEIRNINLNVHPQHYALISRGDLFEVIETPGASPLPMQFFINLNEDKGLNSKKDSDYPLESIGIAKLKDGTLVGGIRHQFKNIENQLVAKTLVEFPAMCPNYIIKSHCMHLALEWGNWLNCAKKLI